MVAWRCAAAAGCDADRAGRRHATVFGACGAHRRRPHQARVPRQGPPQGRRGRARDGGGALRCAQVRHPRRRQAHGGRRRRQGFRQARHRRRALPPARAGGGIAHQARRRRGQRRQSRRRRHRGVQGCARGVQEQQAVPPQGSVLRLGVRAPSAPGRRSLAQHRGAVDSWRGEGVGARRVPALGGGEAAGQHADAGAAEECCCCGGGGGAARRHWSSRRRGDQGAVQKPRDPRRHRQAAAAVHGSARTFVPTGHPAVYASRRGPHPRGGDCAVHHPGDASQGCGRADPRMHPARQGGPCCGPRGAQLQSPQPPRERPEEEQEGG
mmetsp:Transcript_24139/g.59242  ORF Transcript_24139/g.59242 Transcript_24139/m.59242 type:complete len:324 (+) Transcript_24139:3347-4318(+)